MSERFCKVCRQWHDLNAPWPEACYPRKRDLRGDVPAPMLIMDTMDPVQSQVDGKMYDSKAALRATYKPSGNVEGKTYNEIGNDPARLRKHKRKPIKKADVVDSIKRAEARFERGERAKNRNWTKTNSQGTIQ